MINLFKSHWLYLPDEVQSTQVLEFDWETAEQLALGDKNSWNCFLEKDKSRLVCQPKAFSKITFIFWNHILSNFHDSESQVRLWNLLILDYYVKLKFSEVDQLKSFSAEKIYTEIKKINLRDEFGRIRIGDLSFEFQLANFLIDGCGKDGILQNVKWRCWTLLLSELKLYFEETRIDLFSGHIVLGTAPVITNINEITIFEKLEANPNWKLLLNRDLTELFSIENMDLAIKKFKIFFPDPDKLLIIFNNHAKGHKDEQGVDSFSEPIRLIYEGKYEELLRRDLSMDFRITYASEHLSKISMCSMLSYIYSLVRTKSEKTDLVDLFKFRLPNSS